MTSRVVSRGKGSLTGPVSIDRRRWLEPGVSLNSSVDRDGLE